MANSRSPIPNKIVSKPFQNLVVQTIWCWMNKSYIKVKKWTLHKVKIGYYVTVKCFFQVVAWLVSRCTTKTKFGWIPKILKRYFNLKICLHSCTGTCQSFSFCLILFIVTTQAIPSLLSSTSVSICAPHRSYQCPTKWVKSWLKGRCTLEIIERFRVLL